MSKSILIVDGDELVRELLTIRLTHIGYRCHAVPHGEAALALLDRTPVDLAVVDTMMPILSGAETLVRIRANPALSHIPVLVLSQKSSPSERQTVMALGAAGFMAKPFCTEELLTTIERLLAERSGRLLKRLKVTVLGSAALTAALPTTAQAAQPLATPPPAVAAAAQASPQPPAAPKSAGPEIVTPPPLLTAPVAGTPDAERWRTRHSVALVQGRSWISGSGNPDWNDTALSYAFRPTARAGYVFEVDRASRFGVTDVQLSARGDWRVGPRTSVYAAAVFTPSADFREKRGLRAGISHAVMPHVEAGTSMRVGTFVDGDKLALTPYLALSSKNEIVTVIAEVINLWNLDGPADYRAGYGVRVRAQPTSRVRAIAGFARYPEVELGITRDVRSIYGGLSYDLSDAVGVSASYASDRYTTLFTRSGASIGLTYRWRGSG